MQKGGSNEASNFYTLDGQTYASTMQSFENEGNRRVRFFFTSETNLLTNQMPDASSGAFTFADGTGYTTSGINHYALTDAGALLNKPGGSFTKTGARSFTFTVDISYQWRTYRSRQSAY